MVGDFDAVAAAEPVSLVRQVAASRWPGRSAVIWS
jgi:hypothetical protein